MLITSVVNILRSILTKVYGHSKVSDLKLVTKITCYQHDARMMLVTSVLCWRPSTVKYITKISTLSHIPSPTHVTNIRHLWVKKLLISSSHQHNRIWILSPIQNVICHLNLENIKKWKAKKNRVLGLRNNFKLWLCSQEINDWIWIWHFKNFLNLGIASDILNWNFLKFQEKLQIFLNNDFKIFEDVQRWSVLTPLLKVGFEMQV